MANGIPAHFQADYERCLKLAQRDHVRVDGEGWNSQSRVRSWVTTTETTGHQHIVTQHEGKMMECSCEAYKHENYCKHRAIVRFHRLQAVAKKEQARKPAPKAQQLTLTRAPRREDDYDECASDRLAEQANERWFEERGGPTAEDMHEDARERWLESLTDHPFIDLTNVEPVTNVEPAEAQQHLDNWKASYPVAARWLNQQPKQEFPGKEQWDAVHGNVPTSALREGTYTVVMGPVHRTFRVRRRDASWDFAPGELEVCYLFASDNEAETSYKGMALVKGDHLVIYKKYRADTRLVMMANVLLDPKAAEEAGYAYALASSRCYRCNHKLTVPASIHRGLGPVCAAGGRDA